MNFNIYTLTTLLLLWIGNGLAHGMAQPYQNGFIYHYQKNVGELTHPVYWEAHEKAELISIDVREEKKSFINLCTKTGETVKWFFKEEGKQNITAERVGNTIQITGIRFGEKIDETIKIDKRPWFQPLSYSLGSFLESNKKSTSFWVIRADKVEVIAIEATKKGEEVLKIGSEQTPSQKVEIRPDGFLSALWVGTYWYRKSDNLFVRYQSVHGLPGTAETIVQLQKITETEGKK